MLQEPVVIIGIGEMGGVFARGLLRRGHPVYPVTRLMDLNDTAAEMPAPALVLVAVAEQDLHPVLETLPAPWRGRLGLLQNELLPQDWERHGLKGVTVIAVWFEKKKGQDVKVLLPSPVFGPQARLLAAALGALDIPTRVVDDVDAMRDELVLKNLYILTTNVAGLVFNGTVGELWAAHRPLAEAVADDVLALQASLTGAPLNRAGFLRRLEEAIQADPDHPCTGRSAPARLARALARAEEAGLAVPKLREIQGRTQGTSA